MVDLVVQTTIRNESEKAMAGTARTQRRSVQYDCGILVEGCKTEIC